LSHVGLPNIHLLTRQVYHHRWLLKIVIASDTMSRTPRIESDDVGLPNNIHYEIDSKNFHATFPFLNICLTTART